MQALAVVRVPSSDLEFCMGQHPSSPVSNLAMLSERDAAAYLAVSLSTIRRWRRMHIGPEYFRFGDILRYSREALEAFRAKNKIKAVS